MTTDVEPVLQAAALPYRDNKICLISTRSGKGMILPKGHIPEGLQPSQLAEREAWEEAGLIGRIERRPFGNYSFLKLGQEHSVQVHLLKVSKEAYSWPEQRFRQKISCSIDRAIERVSHVELRVL